MLRSALLDQIRHGDRWDIVVVGGGATGLGTAVDAASRGYRTLLLEAHDFAKGTSSRSTKLVHGGVRYLAQGNVKLVREALIERGLLLRNAPSLCHPLSFVIPAYRWWDKTLYGLGLRLYDAMAGSLSLGSTQTVSRETALDLAPTLSSDGLRGGVVYTDGQFDDARLAIALLRTLLDLGGVAVNYLPVVGLNKDGSKVSGLRAQDAETGEAFEVSARVVVNATGVYADEVRRLDEPSAKPMLTPSQGVHLVLDRSFLPSETAVMIPRTDDGRVLFAIPWHGRVVFGTTDTPVRDAPIEPRPLSQEIEFLFDHASRYFAQTPVVRSVFAGLRPLVKGGAARSAGLSRDHTLVVSPSGLVTITGGKWTTCRRMAQDAVAKAAQVADLPRKPCSTETLPLHDEIAPGSGVRLHPDLPYFESDVIRAVRNEMARTVEDVLARRTRALLLDARASVEVAPSVARLLAEELDKDVTWQQGQVRTYSELSKGYQI